MKITYFLFIASLFTIVSCVGEYQEAKRNPITIVEPTLPDSVNSSGADDSSTQSGRNAWQKPYDVFRFLGDLQDKTIADIGAGTGYFSIYLVRSTAEKIIATDIDESALAEMDTFAINNFNDAQLKKLETRLVKPDDPGLAFNEVDVALISNTYAYIEDGVDYLKKVFNAVKPGGRVCIVDYKMRRLPPFAGAPSVTNRLPLYQVENQIEEAGFKLGVSNDQVLDFQYVVVGIKE